MFLKEYFKFSMKLLAYMILLLLRWHTLRNLLLMYMILVGFVSLCITLSSLSYMLLKYQIHGVIVFLHSLKI